MPVITGVKERRGRARVFVDGEFWAELDSGVVAERDLREGAALSHEELAKARVAGERPLAMSRALHSLGYRARSARELNERLSRAGYAGQTVSEVLARLGELGYLDDEEFAGRSELEEARAAAQRRYNTEERSDTQARRVHGFLMRRGYSASVSAEIARSYRRET